MCRKVAGFSLVELTITLALTLALTAAVFTLTQSSRGAAEAQSEAADLQQRTRVAVDTITRDLIVAGAGPYLPAYAGPLNAWIPSVMPYRRGTVGSDPPGTFRTDVMTVMFVPTTAAQTTLTSDVAPGAETLPVARVPVCAAGVNLCAFSPGMTVLAYDSGGAYELFTIAAVFDGLSQIATTTPASALFAAGTAVVAVEVHSYSLKTDTTTQSRQLVDHDGTTNAKVPVLDHVAALAFDYDVPAAELVDGPWRPDVVSDGRWDADLLRIRTVGVTVRLEAALAALRGPAGALFSNGGTATNPRSWVPDQEVRFHVSPRNLILRR